MTALREALTAAIAAVDALRRPRLSNVESAIALMDARCYGLIRDHGPELLAALDVAERLGAITNLWACYLETTLRQDETGTTEPKRLTDAECDAIGQSISRPGAPYAPTDTSRALIRAAYAAGAAAAVPREPTQAMLMAGDNVATLDDCEQIWIAMHDAAESPAWGGSGGPEERPVSRKKMREAAARIVADRERIAELEMVLTQAEHFAPGAVEQQRAEAEVARLSNKLKESERYKLREENAKLRRVVEAGKVLRGLVVIRDPRWADFDAAVADLEKP